jgi:serine/threonine protein kinase
MDRVGEMEAINLSGDRTERGADGAEHLTDLPLPSIPGYVVERELGRGGMGVVYLARQEALNRHVALKVLLHAGFASPGARARFLLEAEALGRLQHPNILHIHDFGTHHEIAFLALEHVGGGTLHHLLAQCKRLPDREAAALVEKLARALDHAHRQGVVHRDLKPGNVLLTKDGAPKVADFGLAKFADSNHALTASGTMMGTPNYMAPEQVASDPRRVGPATDVYGLGAILYEVLTGEPPFAGAAPALLFPMILNCDPVTPRSINSKIPRDLESICLKCLAKTPERRYLSAEALADDLRRFQLGEPIQARPITALERVWLWARRRPTIAALSTALALLALVAWIGLTWLYFRALAGERLAQENFVLAKEAVDRVQTALNDRLGSTSDIPAVRRELLAATLSFYERFLLTGNGLGNREAAASVQTRIGQMHLQQNEFEQAELACRIAVAEMTALAQQAPESAEVLVQLADAQLRLGQVLTAVHRWSDAEAQLRAAHATATRWAQLNPDVARRRPLLVVCHTHRGWALFKLERHAEAAAILRAGRVLAEAGFKENSTDVRFRLALANLLTTSGLVLSGQSFAASEEAFRTGLAVLDLPLANPEHEGALRGDLANTLLNYAALLSGTDRRAEAAALGLRCHAIFRQLAAEAVARPRLIDHRCIALLNLDDDLWRLGRREELLDLWTQAIIEWSAMLAHDHLTDTLRGVLVKAYSHRGDRLKRMGRVAEADADAERARQIADDAAWPILRRSWRAINKARTGLCGEALGEAEALSAQTGSFRAIYNAACVHAVVAQHYPIGSVAAEAHVVRALQLLCQAATLESPPHSRLAHLMRTDQDLSAARSHIGWHDLIWALAEYGIRAPEAGHANR